MGTLALTAPARDGALVTPGNVAATDEIPRSVLGQRGVLLEIINGNASADTVTVSDASTTKTGAAAAAISRSVAASTSRVFKILPAQADPTTKKVTITHSVTSTVTYKMYPIS